jgi:hypothetical protein
MVDDQNEDLRDVLAEEQSRGTRRKKFDAEERRKGHLLRQGVLKAYHDRDEVALKVALLAAGLTEDSPRFAELLKNFRAAISRFPPK